MLMVQHYFVYHLFYDMLIVKMMVGGIKANGLELFYIVAYARSACL